MKIYCALCQVSTTCNVIIYLSSPERGYYNVKLLSSASELDLLSLDLLTRMLLFQHFLLSSFNVKLLPLAILCQRDLSSIL